MNATIKVVLLVSLMVFSTLSVTGCKKELTEEEKNYIARIERERDEKNNFMKNDPASPFNREPKTPFEPLKYFDVDPAYVFKSKLIRYSRQDTITIFGTKGEERKAVRLGYLNFFFEGKQHKVNVYEGYSRKTGEKYYSIWFTDKTTNDETYGVGRYIDFELNENPDYVYTLDFNTAYNPYCAYSPEYSCAIPTKEDVLDIAVRAGEKKFHH